MSIHKQDPEHRHKHTCRSEIGQGKKKMNPNIVQLYQGRYNNRGGRGEKYSHRLSSQ